jgi:hypothetical protein
MSSVAGVFRRYAAVSLFVVLLLSLGSPARSQTGTFTSAGNMKSPRKLFTATLLNNGTVLLAGGQINDSGTMTATAELYNPVTNQFTLTGSMHQPREVHSATLLKDGTVLIAGGYSGSAYLSSAEIYNPSTGTFTLLTSGLNVARENPIATLLLNGEVLLAGGNGGQQLGSAEIYNPNTQTFVLTGSMNVKRYAAAASLLLNGEVLITGGYNGSYTNTAEIYNPATGVWVLTGNMTTQRENHTSTLLGNGNVLIAGGRSSGTRLNTAEVYDPSARTFTQTINNMEAQRNVLGSSILANGQVLVAGGYSGSFLASAELYDPNTKEFTATGSMALAREYPVETLLLNGNVLITGGQASNNSTISAAELYHAPTPVTGYLMPKYQVLSVIYAPPGPQSYVSYGSTYALGNTTTLDNTVSTNTTLTVSSTLSTGKPGQAPGISLSGSDSSSQSWTETQDTSNSISLQSSSTNTYQQPGPTGEYNIDHSYDVIIIQLNPEIDVTETSLDSASYIYTFSPADPVGNVDPINLTVQDLKELEAGTYTLDQDVLFRLKRTWAANMADGSAPGLTSADYAAILARDPFANGSTAISEPRFDQENEPTVNYVPAQCGQGQSSDTVTLANQAVSTQGEIATDEYSVKTTVSIGVSFGSFFSQNFSSSNSVTYTGKVGQSYTVTSGQTATFHIVQPPCTYTGPTNVVVYRDNIYGTFLFNLIP